MTKLSKAQLKYLTSLHLKKYRQQHQTFLVENEKIFLESVAAGWQIEQCFCTQSFFEKNTDVLQGIVYQIIDETELNKASTLSNNTHCLAVLKMPQYTDIHIVSSYSIVLEHIQDPGNLGTILRVADWYGISTVVCSNDTVDVYNPKTVAASMGSFLRVKVVYRELVDYLSIQSLPIYGATLQGENLHQFIFASKGIIVLGNESRGISEEVNALCTAQIKIPCFGQAESLNVAMASAVLCDNLRRQQPNFSARE